MSRDASTELARARSEQAAERTLMAWTRTSLSAIGFGFGIEKVFKYIKKVDPDRPFDFSDPDRVFGALFVALGTVILLAAAIQHWLTLRRIRREDVVYAQPFPIAVFVAFTVVLLGFWGLHAIFS
jgi:putative membrane protein